MSKKFGENLRELRAEKNLLQKDLAKEFGVSSVTITHWERGRQEPSFTTLEKLADYFNVTADYLIGREK